MNTTSPLTLLREYLLLGEAEYLPVQTIIEGLQLADDLYFNDEESPISDAEYDAVRLYAQRINPSDVYFTGIGSAVRGGKVLLPHTMGSLNQIYTGDFTKWVEKHNLYNEAVVISDKLDGNSAMLVYGKDGKLQIAYSRGDGKNGSDIFRHINKIHNVPTVIDTNGCTLTIRGEVIITPTNFDKIKDTVVSQSGRKYKNPRNFVSGRMNASEGQDIVYSHVDFVAYEIVDTQLSKMEQFNQLKKVGFKVAPHTSVVAGELNDIILTQLLTLSKQGSEYEIDGLVIDVDSSSTRSRVNPTKDTLNPEFAVKFKVADGTNYAEPTVIAVELNLSKDGFIKPTIVFTKIELMGVTISRCTGFNMKFIYDNKIQPGVKIKVIRSGDVIPLILGVVN